MGRTGLEPASHHLSVLYPVELPAATYSNLPSGSKGRTQFSAKGPPFPERGASVAEIDSTKLTHGFYETQSSH